MIKFNYYTRYYANYYKTCSKIATNEHNETYDSAKFKNNRLRYAIIVCDTWKIARNSQVFITYEIKVHSLKGSIAKKKKLNLNDYYPGSLITDGLNGLISTREVLFSVHKLNRITLS